MSADAPDRDVRPGDGRDETENERLDRNWNEILQELRVTQTGTQILTGFLLAIAFQSGFGDLDPGQTAVYLGLVILAALSTVLGLAPVSLHRVLFRRGLKRRVVRVANTILRFTLVLVSILVTGVAFFIFDVVAGLTPAVIAAVIVGLTVIVTWLLIPVVLRRGSADADG
jgi:SNF family Na+-dependent transporter